MGEVLAFREREKQARETIAPPPSGGAQILFFLGVRYVRSETPQEERETSSPDQGHGPRGGRKRKSRARA